MPAEHRPDPIQPEPSHLVDAALLLAISLTTPDDRLAARLRDLAELRYGAAFLIPILDRLNGALAALPGLGASK